MKKQETATLTAKQERVALLLAAGKGIKAAAEEAGVGERTVHTWLCDQPFRARVAALRGRLIDDAAGKLADAVSAASDELRALLADESSLVRLRAATEILNATIKIRDHVELSQRVEELEQAIASEKKK